MILLSDLLSEWIKNNHSTDSAYTIEWNSLIDLATRTKTTGLLPHAIKAIGTQISGVPKDFFAPFQNKTVASSFKNIADTIDAIQILKKDQIDSLVFKGPIHSQNVYGHWNIRSSSDVDILVRQSDYENAKKALIENGYISLINPKSQWWPKHLGESPFTKRNGSGLIIDLHHQLQQPGGPFPKSIEPFFEKATEKPFGSTTIKTLSPEDALLITVICYGKALRAGEPWLHYAHEIAFTYSISNESERLKFQKTAQKHGLNRIYNEALKNSLIVFNATESKIDPHNKKRLKLLDLARGKQEHPPFFRTRCLWNWLDGNLLARFFKLLSSLWHVYRSEKTQRAEQRQGIIATP